MAAKTDSKLLSKGMSGTATPPKSQLGKWVYLQGSTPPSEDLQQSKYDASSSTPPPLPSGSGAKASVSDTKTKFDADTRNSFKASSPKLSAAGEKSGDSLPTPNQAIIALCKAKGLDISSPKAYNIFRREVLRLYHKEIDRSTFSPTEEMSVKRFYTGTANLNPTIGTDAGAVTSFRLIDLCNPVIGTAPTNRQGSCVFLKHVTVKVLVAMVTGAGAPFVVQWPILPRCFVTIYRDKLPVNPTANRNIYEAGTINVMSTSDESLFDCQGRTISIPASGYRMKVMNPNTVNECEIYHHQVIDYNPYQGKTPGSLSYNSVAVGVAGGECAQNGVTVQEFHIPIDKYIRFEDPANARITYNRVVMDLRWDLLYDAGTAANNIQYAWMTEATFYDAPESL